MVCVVALAMELKMLTTGCSCLLYNIPVKFLEKFYLRGYVTEYMEIIFYTELLRSMLYAYLYIGELTCIPK